MRRFSIPFLAAIGSWFLTLPAQGQDKKLSDADIRKLLVGKWVHEKTSDGVSMKTHMVIQKEGTFTGEAKIERADKKELIQINVSGTWKVTDRVLELEIKTSDNPRVKVGDIDRDMIIDINDKVLKTRPVNAKGKEPETVWMKAKS